MVIMRLSFDIEMSEDYSNIFLEYSDEWFYKLDSFIDSWDTAKSMKTLKWNIEPVEE
jgi:hypothetical protein